MDRLAKRLRDDAARIDAPISEELDSRIEASLRQVQPTRQTGRSVSRVPGWMWWASSLTGVAAAVTVIAVINLRSPEPVPVIAEVPERPLVMPTIRWQAETAVLTSSLEQEFEDLQTDLKKAEEAVKQDIDRLF